MNNVIINSKYQYDNAGNIIKAGTTNYTYDNLNRLKEVSIDDLQNGKQLASYQYNSFSQRIVKDVNGNKTMFIYNSAGQLLEEINKAQNTTRDYIYVDGILIGATENGILVYIVTDHLNAPQLMMDSNGKQIWSAKYEPFGKATITGNIKLNLRADGQYQDDETGLYYNCYRYYNPDLGRYITSDPMGLAAGMNTYIYVNSNPINYTDPMGLQANGTSFGGSAEYMGPYLGFGINLSWSSGVYSGDSSSAMHGGITVSAGGFVRAGNYVFQYPKPQNNGTSVLHNPNGVSVSGGVSAGVFDSNATCVEQMYGYGDNYNMNFPVLPVGYQHSVSGNIRTNTFSFSAEKLSTGYGASQYPTNTWAFRLPTIDLYRIIHGD